MKRLMMAGTALCAVLVAAPAAEARGYRSYGYHAGYGGYHGYGYRHHHRYGYGRGLGYGLAGAGIGLGLGLAAGLLHRLLHLFGRALHATLGLIELALRLQLPIP